VDLRTCTEGSLKKAVTQTPVLRYYNAAEEVTVQCDASQNGLRSSTSTEGPTSGLALTDPETRYVQIKKELLAIVFACEHFEYLPLQTRNGECRN